MSRTTDSLRETPGTASRRGRLRRVGAGAAVLGLGLWLAACASGSRAGEPTGGQAEGGTGAAPAIEEARASSGGAQASSGGAQASTVRVERRDTEGSERDLERYEEKIAGTLVSFEMIPVPGGTVTVQTAAGPQTVELEPYWIGETEVLWNLFDIYMLGLDAEAGEATGADAIIRPSKPYGAPDRGFGHEGYAALSMSYQTALEFARWLSKKTGRKYRLPTEAEWEHACRGGAAEDPGADKAALAEKAWYWDNALDKTHPAATLQPNAWGFYDMLGNALEWCTGLDGKPVGCGGSYQTKAADLHCGARSPQTPKWQETDPKIPKSIFWLTDAPFIGFRIAREPE